ncbi:MAG: phosphatidate cytidylyltransferase [Burkholderiales bacterium]|nr:phosphatidate cytidylyltransferase [Burkholderiales bacterium]
MMRLDFSVEEAYFTVLSVLIALSIVGTWIGSYLASKPNLSEMRTNRINLVNSRVRASWGLIIIFAVAVYLGQVALLILFAFISFFTLREFIALTPTRRRDHLILVIAFYVAIPVQYLLLGLKQIGPFTLFIPVYLFLALPVCMALTRDTERFLERVAKVQWGIMICIFCVSHAPAITTIPLTRFNSNGLMLMLYFLLVLYFTDLFQIMASAMWGGKPTYASPFKTKKGVVYGSLGALAMGWALFWMTPFTALQALLMSLVIIVSGSFGATVMAAVKRSLGTKRQDTSLLITRGALDRMEMLFFAAPVFYHTTLVFFT